jgi:hypothetical protein
MSFIDRLLFRELTGNDIIYPRFLYFPYKDTACSKNIEDLKIINKKFRLSIKPACHSCNTYPYTKNEISRFRQELDKLLALICKHLYYNPAKMVLEYAIDHYMCHHCTLSDFILNTADQITIKYKAGKTLFCANGITKISHLSSRDLKELLDSHNFIDFFKENKCLNRILDSRNSSNKQHNITQKVLWKQSKRQSKMLKNLHYKKTNKSTLKVYHVHQAARSKRSNRSNR